MTALPLDDGRWHELHDCFGPAEGVPALLRRLRDDPAAAWHDVHTTLCHQGTTYPATYAAVPHVVSFAAALPPDARFEHLVFVAHVEMDRVARTDLAVPAGLLAAYESSLDESRRLLAQTLFARAWDESEARHLLTACAVLLRHPRLGRALDGLDELRCPECAADLGESASGGV